MQALLITAYKSTEQLMRLIELTHKNFLLFIHVDKKSTSIDVERIKNKHFSNLNLVSKYKIPWGGYNHLLAILDLLRLAAADPRVTYIHIISGQDIPIRSYAEFNRFFTNSDHIYMTCTSVQNSPNNIKRRLENWIPFSNADGRKKAVHCVNDWLYFCQKRTHLVRSKLGPFEKVYKGMVWCSFPIETGRYVIEYSDSHKEFMEDLKHTLVPEEFFFQTIVMNSLFKERVVSDNLRYTDWSGRNGSRPSFLDETDYASIMQSRDFFARKIDLQISDKLLNKMMKGSKM